MIIVGYQGIGKSTLANKKLGVLKSHSYIDLESGNFFRYNSGGTLEREDRWYKSYCNIAIHLHNQGFNVFTSSHAAVRQELLDRMTQTHEIKKLDVVIVAPSLELKSQWIEKLKDRYEASKSPKDHKAYAKDCYTPNIKDLMNDAFPTIVIKDMDYDLYDMLSSYQELMSKMADIKKPYQVLFPSGASLRFGNTRTVERVKTENQPDVPEDDDAVIMD